MSMDIYINAIDVTINFVKFLLIMLYLFSDFNYKYQYDYIYKMLYIIMIMVILNQIEINIIKNIRIYLIY